MEEEPGHQHGETEISQLIDREFLVNVLVQQVVQSS